MAGGRPRLSPAALERLWERVDKRAGREGECWLWRGPRNKNGHGLVSIRALSPYPIPTNRLSFYLEHGRWPEPSCFRSCDTVGCMNPAHLYEAERSREHRAPGRSIQYLHMADEIRTAVEGGESQASVATRMGVSQSTVSRIVRGIAYPINGTTRSRNEKSC